ncbi:hypothetical protein SJ593_00700 [Citrobacter freundii]|uniref:hypothetical protein n=1 Tax=Citrobacter freundii TaxID=546 RepID=UPI001FFDF033|nr:hypothetical protein [Citrobacter freundii]MDX7501413.1 hypothetical protein [Citrobacter freundii]
MTSREKFEAWMTDEQWFHGSDFEWDERRNCYAQFGIHLAYKAFLAAEGASEQKLTDMAVQLANAESKCRELAVENVTLNDKMNRLATWPGIEFYSSSWEFCNLDGNDALEFMCDVKTPATDAFLAEVRASAIPEGYVLVPQQIFLDPSDIESICSQCGDGHESGYGDFTDGLLWVGNIQRDDGSIVHGLHISSADYSEEGGVTVCEFAAQLRKGVQS